MCLDVSCQLGNCDLPPEEVSFGGLAAASECLRYVARAPLFVNAASILLARASNSSQAKYAMR